MEELAPMYLAYFGLRLHLTNSNVALRITGSIAQRVQVLTGLR
jgi:hypothetical protein